MTNGRPGSARWIDVAPERLTGWLDSVHRQHGDIRAEVGVTGVTFRAVDGAVAECLVPFPPLAVGDGGTVPAETGGAAGGGAAGGGVGPVAEQIGEQIGEQIAAHCRAPRTVGVILVRLGGYAAGVFTGPAPVLAASKVGSRLVHGRSAAGGTSQHRFARRRENQAREALTAAADTAVAVLGRYSDALDAVVLGGDRRAVAGLREDPRLGDFFDLAVERFLTVPDPRLSVLRSTPRMFRAVRIRLTEPSRGDTAGGSG